MLLNGKVSGTPAEVDFETRKNISSIIDYFQAMHGFDALQPLFKEPIRAETAVDLGKSMGINFVNPWDRISPEKTTFHYQTNFATNAAVGVAGYDYLCDFRWNSYGPAPDYFLSSRKIQVSFGNPAQLEIREGKTLLIAASLDSMLKTLQESPVSMWQEPLDKMTLIAENESVRVMAQFETLNGDYKGDSPAMTTSTGRIFLKLKR